MKKILILTVFVFSFLFLQEVKAADIKAVGNTLMSGSVVSFKFEAFAMNEKKTVELNGTATLYKDNYSIIMSDGIKFVSNGNDLWIINIEDKEALLISVNKNADDMEVLSNPLLLVTNPPAFLNIACEGIIDSDNQIPKTIIVKGFKKDFSKIIININSYKPLPDKSLSQFNFSENDIPGVVITDLR